MGSKRFHIDWPRTIAGALAAVAAAVVLSKLGAAGTLTGAAIGSVVISVGTNIGAHGISTTRARMLEAQKEAARRVSLAQAEVRRARAAVADASVESQQRLAHAEAELASSQSELAQDVPVGAEPAAIENPLVDAPLTDEATRVLPAVVGADEVPPRQGVLWRRVAIFAAASFVIALLAITAFELIGGRPLSWYVGGGGTGTTVTNIGGGGSKPAPKPAVTPSPTVSSTPSPTVTPTPTATATPTPSATPTASGTPTPTSGSLPTGAATPSGTPTVTSTP